MLRVLLKKVNEGFTKATDSEMWPVRQQVRIDLLWNYSLSAYQSNPCRSSELQNPGSKPVTTYSGDFQKGIIPIVLPLRGSHTVFLISPDNSDCLKL